VENDLAVSAANGSSTDVRQKGRQKTCGKPDCMKEQHRRQSEKWNKKNKEYFKNNYLGKKIEMA
jgi:hypothetical protein